MTALLIITLLGSPNVVKNREMSLEQCRPVARMLTEPGRIHARCAILPSRESYGHRGMEPRKGS